MGFLDRFIKNEKQLPNESSSSSELIVNSRKVLVVESNEAQKNLYVQMLHVEKYEVTAVGNGAEGLNMLLTFQPHLILLDLLLPVMDGTTMLRAMRAIPAFKTTPVVVVSDTGDVDTMHQIKTYYNASAFLIKTNVTLREILDIINLLLT